MSTKGSLSIEELEKTYTDKSIPKLSFFVSGEDNGSNYEVVIAQEYRTIEVSGDRKLKKPEEREGYDRYALNSSGASELSEQIQKQVGGRIKLSDRSTCIGHDTYKMSDCGIENKEEIIELLRFIESLGKESHPDFTLKVKPFSV